MSNKRIGFIGCGAMGSAMINRFLNNKKVLPEDIMACDIKQNHIEELKCKFNIKKTIQSKEVLDFAQTIFLAVKPQDMPVVLEDIKKDVTDRHLLVSAAAGITISEILGIVNSNKKVIRLMPNTPCLIGSGMTVLSPGQKVNEAELCFVKELLESLGKVEVLEEKLMDAVTGISGSGPAYVFTFIEALADGGVKAGLPRETALLLAGQTVLGAAEMIMETGEHPSVLKDKVTSPGGTTIAGIYALEKESFRGTVMSAVEAAAGRSKELGKERDEEG